MPPEPSVTRTSISTAGAPQAIGTYSQAIRAGSTVYLSGQIPLDPTTGEIAVRTLTADRTYAAAVGKRTTPVVATTSATSAVLGRAAADVTGDGLVDIVELIQDGSGATLRVMAASHSPPCARRSSTCSTRPTAAGSRTST